MRKLLRHLMYAPIWIALLTLARLLAPDNSLGGEWCTAPAVWSESLQQFIPIQSAFTVSCVLQLTMPMVVAIAFWAAVRLLHRKRPSADCKGSFIV